MNWIEISHKEPAENQKIEFLCDDNEVIATGIYSKGGVYSSYDGYHELKFWRPIVICPNCHFYIVNQE